MHLLGIIGDGGAKLVAQNIRNLLCDSDVPAAEEESRHGANSGIEPGGYAPLDAAHISFGGCDILLARKQQGYIHGDASEDRLLNGWKAQR